MEHDELIKLIFKEYQMADKDKYTNLFLSSLSTHRLEWRSGLPVLQLCRVFLFIISNLSLYHQTLNA